MNTVIQVVRAIQSSLLAFIATVTGQFRTLSEFLEALGGQMGSQTSSIMAQTDALSTYCAGQFTQIEQQITSLQQQLESTAAQLQTIIEAVTVPPIAGVVVTISQQGAANMNVSRAVKAGLDLQIPDDGSKPTKGTITFVDKVEQPTNPVAGATVATVATLSDPSLVATVSADGLTVAVVPAAPTAFSGPLPITGITLSVSVTITNPDGTTIGPLPATATPAMDLVTSAIGGVQIAESQ